MQPMRPSPVNNQTTEPDQERVREELLAIVSHDLRNPLSVVLMNLVFLEKISDELVRSDERKAAQVRRHLQGIQRAVDKMNALIQDFLELARIEAHHVALEKTDLEAGMLINQAIELQLEAASKKGITIERSIAEGLRVWADRERVLQVLSRILDNAIKHSPEKGRVAVGCSATPNGEALFWVQDSGVGVRPENLSKVFSQYWQDRKNAHKATGLALSIVKGIIDAHGGQIWVENPPGGGAKFSFSLQKEKGRDPSVSPLRSHTLK